MLFFAIAALIGIFFYFLGINLYTAGFALGAYFLYGFVTRNNNTQAPPPPEQQPQPPEAEAIHEDTEDHNPRPYGGVIWDDEYTIDELIYKDGKYYINENSEEWEEDEE